MDEPKSGGGSRPPPPPHNGTPPNADRKALRGSPRPPLSSSMTSSAGGSSTLPPRRPDLVRRGSTRGSLGHQRERSNTSDSGQYSYSNSSGGGGSAERGSLGRRGSVTMRAVGGFDQHMRGDDDYLLGGQESRVGTDMALLLASLDKPDPEDEAEAVSQFVVHANLCQ